MSELKSVFLSSQLDDTLLMFLYNNMTKQDHDLMVKLLMENDVRCLRTVSFLMRKDAHEHWNTFVHNNQTASGCLTRFRDLWRQYSSALPMTWTMEKTISMKRWIRDTMPGSVSGDVIEEIIRWLDVCEVKTMRCLWNNCLFEENYGAIGGKDCKLSEKTLLKMTSKVYEAFRYES
jgi:hypothetical protein